MRAALPICMLFTFLPGAALRGRATAALQGRGRKDRYHAGSPHPTERLRGPTSRIGRGVSEDPCAGTCNRGQ